MNNARWFLKKITDGQEVEVQATLSVGRLEGSGLQLKERSASSRHAEFSLTDGALFVTDLGSTNGTFVNGTQLAAKARTPVHSGDRIRFDVEEFETRMVSPQSPPDDGRTVLRESPADFAKTLMVSRPAAVAAPSSPPGAIPLSSSVPPSSAVPPVDLPGGWDAGGGAGTVLIDSPIRASAPLAAVEDGAAADISVPYLYVASGKREKQRIRLVSDESGKSAWTIGSRSDQTIQFDDDGVSAEHAKLSTDGQRWVLTDRITTNGTFVNGKRVPMAWLGGGDRLQFGPVECVFHVPRSMRAAVANSSQSGVAGKRSRTPVIIAVAASFVVTLVVIYLLFRRH